MSSLTLGRGTDIAKTVRYTPCNDSDKAEDHFNGSGALPALNERFRKEVQANGPRSLPVSNSASPLANNKSRGGGGGLEFDSSTSASPSTERTKLLNSGTLVNPQQSQSQQQQQQQQLLSEPPPPWQQRHTPISAGCSSDGDKMGDKRTDELAKSNSLLKDASYTNKSFSDSSSAPITASRDVRKQRRKEIKQKFGDRRKSHFTDTANSNNSNDDSRCHKWTFIFDPAGRLSYWWSMVVSGAFIYNLWVIIYRFAFDEINSTNIVLWFSLDYFADFLYVLDIVFHFRTGYLDDGVLQTDLTKLRIHYMNSMTFYIDCLCLLPLDFLYLSIGFRSMLRCFRLVKINCFWAFLDRTERHTNYPNVVRTISLLHYLFSIYHWNACIMHMIIKALNFKIWPVSPDKNNVFAQYLHALHWSTLALTRSEYVTSSRLSGDEPPPMSSAEYVIVVSQCVLGVLLFAAILGHVANIVTSVSAARKDFQANLDRLKTYMILRRVPMKLQDKVIKWFDYLWMTKKSMEEERTLSLLPDKLKAEIALHVHLDTLKRVEIFQNTDAGFLRDLVLRLKPVLFSPGDYVCVKGEVGKEMYVVSRGRLQVVADNGKTVLAILRPGSYFGEISVLNMGNAGNRRTASVKSVGYSDLFCLSKKDLWDVLKDYPAARVKLEAIAVKRLAQFEKAPLEKIALARSRSTPGLVESVGKVPLELMQIKRHNTVPPNSAPMSNRHTINGQRAVLSQPGSPISRPDTSTGSRLAANNKTATVGIVYSGTASSLTSYVTDSSTPLSPTTVDDVIARQTLSPQRSLLYDNSASKLMMSVPTTPSRDMMNKSPCIAVDTLPVERSAPSAFVAICRPSSPGPLQWQSLTATGHAARRSCSPLISLSQLKVNSDRLSSYSSVVHPVQQVDNSVHGNSSGVAPALGNNTFLNVINAGQHQSLALSPNLTISYGSMTPSPEPTAVVVVNQDLLQHEVDRLRQRLHTLETENATLGAKLSRQQWEVDSRLSEIEMHICSCSGDSTGSAGSGCGTELHQLPAQYPANKESVI